MTDLDEMWRELERYQPYAEKHGFGDAWKRMTTERTQDAAFAASAAAAAYGARHGAEAAQRAIRNIRDAIEQEDKT